MNIINEHYKLISKLGSGAFSQVCLSTNIINNKKVEICRGITKLAFYDPKTKKPKKCPLVIKEKFFNS